MFFLLDLFHYGLLAADLPIVSKELIAHVRRPR